MFKVSINRLNKILLVSMRQQPLIFASTFTTTKTKDPLRCIDRLKEEHSVIGATMQAFEIFLDHMQSESKNKNMLDHASDLNKFIAFCREYNMHHHTKEEIMFNKVQSKEKELGNDTILSNIEDLQDYHEFAGSYLYRLFDNTAGNMNIDQVVMPSRSFIQRLFTHMREENANVYPGISAKLSPQEMEELSAEFDIVDEENRQKIEEIEAIANELCAKYSTN
eukprot:404085_1